MGDQVVHDARVGLATVRTRVLRCQLTLQIFMTVDETEVKGDWINRARPTLPHVVSTLGYYLYIVYSNQCSARHRCAS